MQVACPQQQQAGSLQSQTHVDELVRDSLKAREWRTKLLPSARVLHTLFETASHGTDVLCKEAATLPDHRLAEEHGARTFGPDPRLFWDDTLLEVDRAPGRGTQTTLGVTRCNPQSLAVARQEEGRDA